MGHMQNALRGYGETKRQTASDKQIELQVFTSVTSRLRAHFEKDSKQLTAELADALLMNTKLWNILFCDLVNPDNTLPQDLKTSLISLSEFTSAHTQRVLQGEADFSVLIDINDSVILGLRSAMKTSQPATPAETYAEAV